MRRIRRPHLHRCRDVIPVLASTARRTSSRSAVAVTRDQVRASSALAACAEKEDDLSTAARLQFNRRLQSSARIESGADPARKAVSSFESSGMIERAVAAEELRPITGPRGLPAAQDRQTPRDRRTRCSKRCARTSRRVSASISVTMKGSGIARAMRRAPIRRTPSPTAAAFGRNDSSIVSREILIGSSSGTNCSSSSAMPCDGVLEAAVALAVSGDIGARPPRGSAARVGRPQLAGLFVAHVDHLAGRIADRIIRPRRQLIFAAVERPGVARARFGHLKAKRGIGDHVDPGRRRPLSLAENRHVFTAVGGETAQAIEELQFRPRRQIIDCLIAGGRRWRASAGFRVVADVPLARPRCRGGSKARPGRQPGAVSRSSAEMRSPRRINTSPNEPGPSLQRATGWPEPGSPKRPEDFARRRRAVRSRSQDRPPTA